MFSGGTYIEQATRSDAAAEGFTAVFTAFTGDTSPQNAPFRFQAYKMLAGSGVAMPLSTNDVVFTIAAGSSNAFSVQANGVFSVRDVGTGLPVSMCVSNGVIVIY
jgi:hypothetical protein